VRLLHSLGYDRVRHYKGGIAEWKERSGPVEGTGVARSSSVERVPVDTSAWARRRDWLALIVDALGNRSIGQLLLLWLWMIVGFGVAYWASGLWSGDSLRVGSVPVRGTWEGMLTALYFSCVTALSIGYGDVVPVGLARLLAIAEGATGLLIFGCVISKLVSRHQEELTEEIHRIAFEDRLGRVRTNLHLVLSDLQAIARICAEPGVQPARMMARIESVVSVFAGELRTIHDLLYRPQQIPDEQVLEAILANLAAGIRELIDLLSCLAGEHQHSASLEANLRSITQLAQQICGECVPRSYTPRLRSSMDTIHELASRIS